MLRDPDKGNKKMHGKARQISASLERFTKGDSMFLE